jgi:hypothetical protein
MNGIMLIEPNDYDDLAKHLKDYVEWRKVFQSIDELIPAKITEVVVVTWKAENSFPETIEAFDVNGNHLLPRNVPYLDESLALSDPEEYHRRQKWQIFRHLTSKGFLNYHTYTFRRHFYERSKPPCIRPEWKDLVLYAGKSEF